jgi:RimJ/RimL family protein N-acetyltransferase
MSPPVRLRPARAEDAALLLAWRNEPSTRAASFSGEAVGAREHARWLATRLADPATLLLVAERDGVAVAQVRLDREPDAIGVVSIAVAPEARGAGVARAALDALAARDDLGVSTLRALVKPGNAASRRLFRRAGYTEVGGPDPVVFERPAR